MVPWYMNIAIRSDPLESVLVARGTSLERMPAAQWQANVRSATNRMRQRLAFMSSEHHAIRNFVVSALPRMQRPILITEIARGVAIADTRVEQILIELERNLFFVVRNAGGDVTWAFPVTADPTAHHIDTGSGQRIFGACAEDAFAAPFVLGRLSGRQLRGKIRSVCGQSGRPIHLTVASGLSWRAHGHNARHLLFVPSVDWKDFHASNIIDGY